MFDLVIIDEASQVSRELIDEVIRPALSDRKGWMSLCGTPKGMNNIFYDMYQKAQSNKDWFLYTARASETKLVDTEELKAALSVMGQATYNQEFECSFIGNVKGSIYGELITKLENEKREIYLLKQEYLSVVIDDVDDIMPYKKGSTQYVSETLKRAENIRLYE